MTFQQILDYLSDPLFSVGGVDISLLKLFLGIFILVIARFLVWLVGRVLLSRLFTKRKIDVGRQYAIQRFVIYVIYVLAFLWVLDSFGLNLTVLWAGSAALLVGVGIGLQQTFNDLVCGLILLVEGTVEVGDIVVVDGLVGTVRKIGLRVSQVETRNRVTILIPNSKLIVDNVTNWSHNEKSTRFQVEVGVAYASDPRAVERILLEAAVGHPQVLKIPKPLVEFKDYGDSALIFVLHFFSEEFLRIEFVKSDLRFEIMEKLRENQIEIPFPQRDLWLRNPEDLGGASR